MRRRPRDQRCGRADAGQHLAGPARPCDFDDAARVRLASRRVGRVAGSLGLQGAETWRRQRGRGSLKNDGVALRIQRIYIIYTTILKSNHHHHGDN